ncbi:MAG: hypothetical protein LC750_07570 [Actinobacteria bacterium]|nr:hypothetical protein [Actinomycetota bacterium]
MRSQTTRPDPEPVGLLEIAERLGVRPQTARNWRGGDVRVPMPAPRWTVSGMPAWAWDDVEAWARATGRLAERGTGRAAVQRVNP